MERGNNTVEVNDNIIKIPNDCGIVTEIVYDNKKVKVIEVSPNYDFMLLEFYKDDKPKSVTIYWVKPSNIK